MLELRGVQVGAGSTPLFEGLDCQFDAGLITSIRKGGVLDGSSTLLKCCAGILPVQGGEISWKTQSVHQMPVDCRFQAISYCFEAGGLVSLFTVYNNIAIPLRYHGICDEDEVEERVQRAMTQLGIAHLTHAEPHELNDVQQRLVNLARAFAIDADVLLIDELQTGMSQVMYSKVVAQLQAQAARNKTVVMVTTSGDEDGFADRHLLIKDRTVVERT
ncbi:ABC transporter ATP-binding protein [Allohahella marinimesophila]|uniref:ABC transporter ATP-binding protein n=1 Tax=Allohahella marinimesophila TaxID=1054972 RepID=A0ABP7NHY4_9GAMM